MNARNYTISLGKSEHNFSGLNCYSETPVAIRNLVPTVANVRSIIAEFFPSFEIGERWETLFEQIHGDLFDCGIFSIDLRQAQDDEFISYSASFDEIPN